MSNSLTQTAQAKVRPETGPMQFGDDWKGLFIRGDNAAGYGLALQQAIEAEGIHPLVAAQLRGLLRLLQSSDQHEGAQPQQAILAAVLADHDAQTRHAFEAVRQHMLLTLADMGVEDGKTLADVQRGIHVNAPTAMRLFALLNAVKGLPAPPAQKGTP